MLEVIAGLAILSVAVFGSPAARIVIAAIILGFLI